MHGLEKVGGVYEIALSNKSAWHRFCEDQGTIFDPGGESAMTLGDAERLAPGVFVERRKVPVVHGLTGVQLPGTWIIDRADTGTVLSETMVSDSYRVIQVREAAELVQEMVREGIELRLESLMNLEGGKRAVLQYRLPEVGNVDGDKYLAYLNLIVPFTGRAGLHAYGTMVRTVCANTERVARRGREVWSIRHTGDVGAKLLDLQDALSGMHGAFESALEAIDLLSGVRARSEDEREFEARMWPEPEVPDVEAEDAEVSRWELATRRRGERVKSWRECLGVEEDLALDVHRGSFGVLYQALTRWVDHGEGAGAYRSFRSRGGVGADERRAVASLDGAGAREKARGKALLLKMASGRA